MRAKLGNRESVLGSGRNSGCLLRGQLARPVIPLFEHVRSKSKERGAALVRPEGVLAGIVRVEDRADGLDLADPHAQVARHHLEGVEAVRTPRFVVRCEDADLLPLHGPPAARELVQLALEVHRDDGWP